MLKSRLQELLEEVKQGLRRLYGTRLEGVYLFGSYARGEADAESDVDVLVVLDQVTHYGREVERTGDLMSKLSLRYDVSISCVYLRQEDWRRRQSPFLLNVREEAVAA